MKFSKPKSRSVLSLDVGSKRIGLAYCDPLCITINILPALQRDRNNKEILILENYIKKHCISGIIIGLPLDEEGNMTTQAYDCKLYGELVKSKLKLPSSFVNEHSSSWESTNRFGIKKDKSG